MAARTKKTEDAAVTDNAEEATTTRRRLDLSTIEVTSVEDSEEGVKRERKPGAKRGGLPEDHPLAVAFKDSYENGVAKTVRTNNPEDAARALQNHANRLGLGLDKSLTEDAVTFQARERRVRNTVEERTEDDA